MASPQSTTVERTGHRWTGRQREVLNLLARGRTNAQIADELGVSLDGAKWHVREIMAELDAPTREDAAEYWRAYNGLPSRFSRFAHGLLGLSFIRGVAVAVGAVAAVGIAVAVTFVAFGGGDEPPRPTGPETTSTPGGSVAAASATPVVNPNDRRTGIPEVDHLIELILAKDTAGLLALANSFPEKCSTTPPQGVGSRPLCPPGTPDGGDVFTTRGLGCESQALSYLFDNYLLKANLTLYTVFRPTAGELFNYLPKGEYSIVFDSDNFFPQRYEVGGGRLNGVWVGCGGGPDMLRRMTADAGSNYIIPRAFVLPAPTPTPAPDKSGYPDGWDTGVPGVNIAVQAVMSRNAPRIAAHFKLSSIGCITEPVGFPSPPFCKEGQAKGTPVDVLLVVGCDGSLREASELARVSQQLAAPDLRLYAVYRRLAPQDPVAPPDGDYRVILNQPGSTSIELGIDGGQIVSVWFGCGATATEMAARVPKASWILPPP